MKQNQINIYALKLIRNQISLDSQLTIIKILNTQMEDEANCNLHRRRYSLLDRLPDVKQATEREQIKNKYRQFIQSRLKSFEQRPLSLQSKTLTKTQQFDYSMPSIRKIREQREIIKQALRQTITRSNYVQHEKQVKLQYLNRKKMKYQKVLQIRQQHNKQKMKLNSSRLTFLKQLNEQKLKLKRTVDSQKQSVHESKIKFCKEKKSLGDQRRQQQNKNKSRILQNRSKLFEFNKKLHSSVAIQEQRLKMRKKILQRKQRRINTQNYFNKLTRQIVSFNQIQQRQQKTKRRISPKIQKAKQAKSKIEQELRSYQDFLKQRSTLNKFKTQPKKNPVSQKTSQNRVKVRSKTESSVSFY